jgi:cell division transport system permease protein
MKKNKYKISASGHVGMQSITSSISIMLVLLLLGLVALFVLSAKNLSVFVRENMEFSIVFNDSASQADVLTYWKQINKQPYVKSATYISKAQALKEQTEAMGSDPTDFLGYNPFTPIIEVRLKSAYANSDSIAKIKQQIKNRTDIEDISYQKDLIDSVNSNIRNISLVLLALAVLLTMISFVLINNTIRLSIYSKRFIIHTMKLVGASWGFIRKPFLVHNIWMGIISAVVADALLGGGVFWLISYEPEVISIITPEVMLIVSVVVLFFGIFIPFICAYFSLNRFLRMKANSLYNV